MAEQQTGDQVAEQKYRVIGPFPTHGANPGDTFVRPAEVTDGQIELLLQQGAIELAGPGHPKSDPVDPVATPPDGGGPEPELPDVPAGSPPNRRRSK